MNGMPPGQSDGESPERTGPASPVNTRKRVAFAFVAGLLLGFVVTLVYLIVR